MKLKELIEGNLVKDDHNLVVNVPIHGSASQIRKGNWFHDRILDVMDREIDTIEYQIGGLWYINLTHDEDD
jgi:hypothetical protein